MVIQALLSIFFSEEYLLVPMLNYTSRKSILVIGGGRWARTILKILDSILPQGINLAVYSSRNHVYMSEWICNTLKGRYVNVFSSWDQFTVAEYSSMIVANSASDHECAARKALLNKVPVLVEKPLATSLSVVQSLLALEQQTNTKLCVALVFTFASYIQNFVELCSLSKEPTEIIFQWTDPTGEYINSEKKSFDPSIPVFVDCLPHITSIISPLINKNSLSSPEVSLSQGGSNVWISFRSNNTSLKFNMARNWNKRIRLLTVQYTSGQSISIDFSCEPGILSTSTEVVSADPCWNPESSPLADMLIAFLSGVCSGVWDQRLCAKNALFAATISNLAAPLYRSKQSQWLSSFSSNKYTSLYTAEILYAKRELYNS